MGRPSRMKVRVICSKCNNETIWLWGKQTGTCDCCDSFLNIKEVKLKEGEIMRLLD